jgi:hypothetical protein
VRFQRLLALLLVLPCLAVEPLCSVRLCLRAAAATAGCCDTDASASCCAPGQRDSRDPVTSQAGRCDSCCVDIETPAEQLLPGSTELARHLEHFGAAAFAIAPRPHDLPGHARVSGPSVIVPSRAPATPGDGIPLPLRI